ncbi:hypothetical protein GAP32_524 [Cronobacter phage vB_CsaM_GAP32]|uniref:Uncharacterized protein n=1 Tax=Cronobacter phage vB_CsaM_GAP32 TaxID=1141136 RepID=K4FBA1_9CAUD|nr:hypothetical protein GAP32_524 [Cronobacter phage vB_CsaM_GAP32]AFC21984.1 hypothetical protein GAP32_524 [Cronobacter phage vB_CsaM_GAP32]
MIKLCFEDKTLKDLDANLLPFVQWKSVTVADTEGVPTEVLSKYVFEMAKPVMKSLVKNNRIDLSNLNTKQWIDLIDEANRDGYSIFDLVQVPYGVIMEIMNDGTRRRRHASKIARTQNQMPVELALKHLDTYSIKDVMRTGSNMALLDYMFSDEGVSILKLEHNVNHFTYVTSAEAAKLGLKIKNRTISTGVLRRAGACSNGMSYCTKILKELNVDSITWDDAIKTIRSNPKLQNRASLFEYMDWIVAHSRRMD